MGYDRTRAGAGRFGTLRTVHGDEVVSFADAPVANRVRDTSPPVVERASVNGRALAVVFDEPLGAAAALSNGAFAVRRTPAGGAGESVALAGAPAIDGATLTLTLASAVEATDTDVRVSYAQPASGTGNRLVDAAGNAVAFFAARVANATDATPPSVAGASVRGAVLVVRFDELLGASTPAPGAFEVTVDGAAQTPGAVTVAGRSVRLALARAVTHGQAVAVRYTKPASGATLRDGAGEEAAGFAMAVANATPPAATGARTSTDGLSVTIDFDAALDAASVPSRAAFTVTRDSQCRKSPMQGKTERGVHLGRGGDARARRRGLRGRSRSRWRYTVPDTRKPLRDAAGHAVVSFDALPVENNRDDVTPPAFESAATSLDGRSVVVTFDEALDAASKPAPGAFTVTVTAGGVADARTPSAVSISGAAVTLALAAAVAEGDAVEVAYAAPSEKPLRDSTGHAVERLHQDGRESHRRHLRRRCRARPRRSTGARWW